MSWAQLIEPDGTLGITMTMEAAARYCREHPGWTWREAGDEADAHELVDNDHDGHG